MIRRRGQASQLRRAGGVSRAPILAAWGLLILGMPPYSAGADEHRPALDTLLHRAGAMTVTLEDRLAVIAATEEYHQGLLVGRDASPRVRRKIVSDVVWVPTADAMVWAFFRDVFSVDGSAVVDRAKRLELLFSSGSTVDAQRQAADLLDESARYNLGVRRTVNTPTFTLAILHPRNQSRFRFALMGEDKREGAAVLKVRFSETARPALSRTSNGTDVPAAGILWIEPAQGTLVASELHLDAPGLPTVIKVRFQRVERLEAWLPFEMAEEYGNRSRSAGEERLEATARYSDFRRAEVEAKVIFPRW